MEYYIAYDKDNNVFYTTPDISKAVLLEGNIISFNNENMALDMADNFTETYGIEGPCGITVHYCAKKDRFIVIRHGYETMCKCS